MGDSEGRGRERAGRRGEGEGRTEVVSKKGGKRRDRAAPMENRIGLPHSSHWRSEDTQSCSVHHDGCWGYHNGPDRQHLASVGSQSGGRGRH